MKMKISLIIWILFGFLIGLFVLYNWKITFKTYEQSNKDYVRTEQDLDNTDTTIAKTDYRWHFICEVACSNIDSLYEFMDDSGKIVIVGKPIKFKSHDDLIQVLFCGNPELEITREGEVYSKSQFIGQLICKQGKFYIE